MPEEKAFSSGVSRFHCARGDVSIRFLTLHAEAILFDAIVCRKMGPGAMPLVGAGVIPLPQGTGAAKAPASTVAACKIMAEMR